MPEYSIADLAPYLPPSHRIVGDAAGKSFSRVAPTGTATPDSLVWISPTRSDKRELLEGTAAGFAVCDPDLGGDEGLRGNRCLIVVPNPKVVFSEIVAGLFVEQPQYVVHPAATVHPEANLEEPVSVGPNAYVGRSSIGAGTVIHGNVYVYDNVTIGRNVVIHAGCVIGGDGFGFERDETGRTVKFPHIGGVVIQDDVEIQALTTVDRGALTDTVIGRGACFDDHVHVAHGVEIGEGAFVAAHAMLAGSVKVGHRAWIGPSVAVRDYVTIGDEAFVGIGALVVKDVPPGAVQMGAPARDAEEYKHLLGTFRQLLDRQS